MLGPFPNAADLRPCAGKPQKMHGTSEGRPGQGEAGKPASPPLTYWRGEGRKERTLAPLLSFSQQGCSFLWPQGLLCVEHLLPSKPMGSPLPVEAFPVPQIDRRAAMMGSSFLSTYHRGPVLLAYML